MPKRNTGAIINTILALGTFLFILLLTYISFNPTAAHPTSGKLYPEVIPGPGIPTLAELGFTSADLYTMEINSCMKIFSPNLEAF
jgi:hypothetical protein